MNYELYLYIPDCMINACTVSILILLLPHYLKPQKIAPCYWRLDNDNLYYIY